MMSILETILAAQGGDPVRKMGARVGVDENQAQAALQALLPMLAAQFVVMLVFFRAARETR